MQALEADRACAPDRATNVLALTTRAAWQPWRGVASGVAWLLAWRQALLQASWPPWLQALLQASWPPPQEEDWPQQMEEPPQRHEPPQEPLQAWPQATPRQAGAGMPWGARLQPRMQAC